MALFSSRKTRSNSSGKPGHLRRDFLQLPHVGLFSSHCAQSVRDRAWLSSGADATRRDRTHQRTLILLLLHMPHPRLGLPVYTMLEVGRRGERMGGGTQQSQKYSLWALFSPARGDDPRQDRSERVYQENAGSPPPQHTTIIRPARRTLRSLSSSAHARHRPRFQDKRDEGHSSHALRNRIVWYAGSERNGVRTPERVPKTWMRAQWQGR
jgi:hypothetical protein